MIFKETLIKKLGLENLSEEEKLKVLEETSDIVFDRVLIRLMNELSEEEANEFNNLLENEKEDEVAKVLYAKFPNINDIFDEEIEKVKEELA